VTARALPIPARQLPQLTRTLQVSTDQFPTDPTGLAACHGSEVVDLSDGETFELEIAAVANAQLMPTLRITPTALTNRRVPAIRDHRKSLGMLVVVGLALGLIAGLSPQPAPAASSSAVFARQLDEDRWLAAFEVPGVAVALVRDGHLTWSKGYGQADTTRGVPVTSDTIFQVGSISKPVTAWGVMRLVQQGKLDLDAPVDRYLTRWHLPPGPFDAHGVTIRRLLNHSAGLNSQDYSPIATRPLPSLEQSLSGESGGVNARRGSDDVRITMTPGQQRSYSNGGYTLLQLAIEEVTGEPFAGYMQREVLDPLGMNHSSFRWRADQRSNMATGYDVDGRAVPRSALTEQAAGGLHTTVEDLAAFVAAGMTGPHGEPAGRGVLAPEGVAALFTRHRLPDGSTTSPGYEVQTLPDGTHAAGHGGKNIGWRAEFLILPDRREGIVVLTNSDRMDGILGLTEQAWGEWLGTGPPMTSQMQQSTLQPLYTLIISITGALLLASSICLAFAWRRPRTGRRQWLWRHPRPPGAVGSAVRGVSIAAALTAAGTWALLPLREQLATITPVRVTLLTSAVLLFCVVATVIAVTRRTTSRVHHIERPATVPVVSRSAA
jgi:CubicO group peptidase (beta-lactamase class C family)